MVDNESRRIFSVNLRNYLNLYEMSQAECARRLGVSSQALTDWLRCHSEPRMKKIDRKVVMRWMCRVYDKYLRGQVGFTADTKKEAERQAALYQLTTAKKRLQSTFQRQWSKSLIAIKASLRLQFGSTGVC